MSKFEHLLGVDPIGAFDKIKKDYVRYFENAYHIEDKKIDDMRMEEIENDDNLYKDPYLEILPEYETYSGINDIEDLAPEFTAAFGTISDAEEFFKEFIKAGLMSYVPYGHQVGMLRKAFAEGKNVVITSGTGSGKTESFLLPLFAQLFKEAKSWPQANYFADWYRPQGTRYEPCQRENEHSDRPALRALVLYPMNALVADQMSRLRKALDSDLVRDYMDANWYGNRIFFGGYNGSTIGQKSFQLLSQGDPTKFNRAKEKVAEQLGIMASRFDNICRYYNNLAPDEKKAKEEALYVNPRLNNSVTAEMLTRWDMQQTPPDIMITNVSMLSIMLMREAEKDIFKQTYDWLNGDPDKEHPTRIFHLILDELHLYRGTAGSEVACLVRMLLDTIGLKPVVESKDAQGNVLRDNQGKPIMKPNPQLRILASSASLGSTERGEHGEKSETEQFLEEFFGVYNSDGSDAFEVQKGSNYCPNATVELEFSIFSEIAPDFIELEPEEQLAWMNAFAARHKSNSIKEFTLQHQEEIFTAIYNAIPKNKDNSLRAINLNELATSLFGSVEALRGFLIYRGFVDQLNDQGGIKKAGEKALVHRLPRIRFHQFFKYIEGLWGELQPTIRSTANGFEMATDSDGKPIPPIRKATYEAQEVGGSGSKILELLRCENCGELFIGGNRRSGRDIAMSLNYPELSKMPNFNPTPMVQNKSYNSYVIFWPTHDEPNPDLDNLNERVALLGNGRYSFLDTNGRGRWRHAYLNAKTGVIKDAINNDPERGQYIEGYLYYIVPYQSNQPFNTERIQALPCSCPHCAMDYARRIHVKSPIRSFRTGIDRSNQILSKELMYQLSENSQKLIGFSDSREDAAKQAYGIELEQYRDMVRMLFVDCVNEINVGVQQVINQIERDRAAGITFDLTYTEKFENWTIPNAQKIANRYISGHDLSCFRKDYVELENFIGNPNQLDGILVKKLVQLGINPAGVDYKVQFTNEARTTHWNRAFNWTNFTLLANTNQEYRECVYENLISAVFANSFGKYMGVSVLDAGIGYICCKRGADKENSVEYRVLSSILTRLGLNVYDFIDAFIRILGDNYRYNNNEFDDPTPINGYNNFGKYKKYVRAVADNYNIDENELGVALYNYFSNNEKDSIILEFKDLGFKLMNENARYYECPTCHRVHPNLGMGVCTSCGTPLSPDPEPNKTVRDLWSHYISHDILVEKKKARRLHTEELTGQTDDIQTRLLEFKDLILLERQDEPYRRGEEMSKEIDMVNVTTTMEVGVDIGSLEAIFQGNMSPTRYNYQQRVGRGGRRGQAFSTAFTFCRGRSHDVHYYKNATEEIVGGLPAAPKLSLAPYKKEEGEYHLKLAIIKRAITKNILREAFRDSSAIGYVDDMHDTCGEFGLSVTWATNKPHIENWINNNSETIRDIIDLYTDQFNTNNCNITNDIQSLQDWVENNMLDEITNIAQHSTYTLGLAQNLAEGGLLPMYGMPSDLRKFYHGFNHQNHDLRSIDRSSEMAVNEFAPGSEKTKDKGKYRVEGITTSLRYQERDDIIMSMNPYDLDALHNCYTMTIDQNSMQDISSWRIDNVEPNDDILSSKVDIAQNLAQNQRMLIIPMAYRTYKLFNNDGQAIDSNDRSSHFSQSTIFAKDNANSTNTKLAGNVQISAYGLYLNDEAEVWHINTNNNELFRGKYASRGDNLDGCTNSILYRNECPNCGSSDLNEMRGNFSCNNCGHVARKRDFIGQFVSSNSFMFYELVRTQGANAREYLNPMPEDERYSFDIAIGSRKPTEMIKLELQDTNDFINLDVQTGNESAIRAAFYSAAFLLQRTLADRLDVSPDEIEISEKIVNNRPQIYLSDTAPNGAGIVSYLYQDDNLIKIIEDIVNFNTPFMKSLLNESHSGKCKTACQECLLTYNNRGFHHVLDWRLGVSILRLMLDPNYDMGFNPETRPQYKELADYDMLVEESAQKLGQDWGNDYYHNARNLRGVENLIIYHPLWNKIRLIAMAKSDRVPTDGLAIYNTFRVLRSDLEADTLPENIDQIPARTLNDQGQSVDPETNIVLDVTL